MRFVRIFANAMECQKRKKSNTVIYYYRNEVVNLMEGTKHEHF